MTPDPGLTRFNVEAAAASLAHVEDADSLDEIDRAADVADARETLADVLAEFKEAYPDARV